MTADGTLDRRGALLLGAMATGMGAGIGAPGMARAQVSITGPGGAPVPIGPVQGPGTGDNALDVEVTRLLDDLNRLLLARDPNAAGLFAQGNCLLVGSATDEVFVGHAAVGAHLEKIYALPQQLSFAWDHPMVRYLNESAAWLWAEGHVELTAHSGEKTRSPYRLTAVLVRQRGEWKFQLFSGSEPKG